MYLVTRVLMLLAGFLALRSLWRLLTGWQEPSRRSQFSKPRPIAGELKKDPNCGTYVSAEISLKSRLGKDEFHFCSSKCQQEFLRARGVDSD
jgi:YHS domain-containing protein